MASRVSHTTFNCGYADVPGDPYEAGDEECITDHGTGHRLLFIALDELQDSEGRIHLDLAPVDRRRDQEI